MPERRVDKLWAKYEAKCGATGCTGTLKFEQAWSAGLMMGSQVPEDPTNPLFGRCPRCRRHSLIVTVVPMEPVSSGPKGFTKIPTS